MNNYVYINNSTISPNSKIRIYGLTHKLYIGKGNNFTIANVTNPRTVTEEQMQTIVISTDNTYS